MSVSQTLIEAQHDLNLFAPCWQAGISSSQSLTKSLRNFDIEGVNIVKTCDKLCLAIKENTKSNTESFQTVEDANKQCTVKNSTTPFRDFSNIWFGTLKIYQQQVNTLLRLSQDLLSRSCHYNVKHLETTKRKSSSNPNKIIKKRRLTLSKSNEFIYSTNNYSDLLEDLEKLTQDTMQNTLEESSHTISGRGITQFQIREITIREISATAFLPPDEINDDSGFGEATHEEIAEFFNFFEETSKLNAKGTPTKRKASCERGPLSKQSRYIDDSLGEPRNNEKTMVNENILKAPLLKRSITPDNNTFSENKFMENIHNPVTALQLNNNCIEIKNIKKENESVVENLQMFNSTEKKKKKNNLIIDECTKIDILDIMEEMKSCRLPSNIARKRILKTYKSKKITTALELLTRFNRRSLKLSLSLKQNINLSRVEFEREYLNLLREILKVNNIDKLASEIYPKWKCFEDVLRKQNKNKCKQPKKIAETTESDLYNLNEVLNTDSIDKNNFSVTNYENLEIPIENMNQLNTSIHQNWRPYSVMMKLLNLWRLNQTNKIAARALFKLAENRIDRALGFYSLLNLSKTQFVYLTNFPETIELQNILMGIAIKCKSANTCT